MINKVTMQIMVIMVMIKCLKASATYSWVQHVKMVALKLGFDVGGWYHQQSKNLTPGQW